jgi:hypothetical protein
MEVSVMSRILMMAIFTMLLATASAQPLTTESDLDLIAKIKAAIAERAETKSLAVTVSVVDGVAVVGGAVPSAAVADRLMAIVKGVPGLADASVHCWIPASVDPLTAAVQTRLQSSMAVAAPLPDAPPPLRIIAPARPTVAQRGEPATKPTGYSPVPPPAPPAPAGSPEHETIPAVNVPVKPVQDVAAAVDAVRHRDRRFAQLQVKTVFGQVVVSGVNADAAWDFADAVRKVPGVDRVIVRSGITGKPGDSFD